MGFFNEWKKRKKPEEQSFGFEYYEDTHNEFGEYVGPLYANKQPPAAKQQSEQIPDEESSDEQEYPRKKDVKGEAKIPGLGEQITPRNYQNVVVYKPTTPEDVQTLIDFLKRREPAIVNLDDVDSNFSQRILDFVSGAIYALSGSIHRIAGNIFLLSPEGVEITVPYQG